MSTTRGEPVQARTMCEETCGILIAVTPMADSPIKVGRSSTLSSDGPTMQRVRLSAFGLRRKKFINWCVVGSVLAYAFYWIAVVVALVYMKFKEVCFQRFVMLHSFHKKPELMVSTQGRTKLLGRESAAGIRRREIQATQDATAAVADNKTALPA